jgi:hypothetical protein
LIRNAWLFIVPGLIRNAWLFMFPGLIQTLKKGRG